MKRIDIFKKMENDCLTAVHTAAIAYGMHNVEVLIQSRRMKVTVFAGKGAVSYTIFSTGKLVIQSTDNIKEIEPVTEETASPVDGNLESGDTETASRNLCFRLRAARCLVNL